MEARFFHMTGEDASLAEIREKHVIPVYARDNEPLISQAFFIDAALEGARSIFGVDPQEPVVRLSHPIQSRRFEARNKPKAELLPEDIAYYYERMAFVLNIPGYEEIINGQETSLAIVGVKAYNLDSLTKSGAAQHFKFGIGRRVSVCLNMALNAEMKLDVIVQTESDLRHRLKDLLQSYDDKTHVSHLKGLANTFLTEPAFAGLLGRARMYDALPKQKKEEIPALELTDTQIKSIASAYFADPNFGPAEGPAGRELSIWSLYNLMTDASKSSYIDTFLDRNQNCLRFCQGISSALEGEENGYEWFLN